MSPQFIYFDLDDTLLDHRRAERLALGDVHAHFPAFEGLSLRDVQAVYHTHNVQLWKDYADKLLDKPTLKRQRFAKLLSALAVQDLDPNTVSDFYMQRYAHYWMYCEGAAEAFATLAATYPVGVVTNGFAEVQHAKLARFPEIRDRLQALIISEEVGHMKPHPALFDAATNAAQTAREGILYIGDSYHSDVQGALQAGWQIAWYTPQAGSSEESGVFSFKKWETLVERLAE